jgi:hypothetical protein
MQPFAPAGAVSVTATSAKAAQLRNAFISV